MGGVFSSAFLDSGSQAVNLLLYTIFLSRFVLYLFGMFKVYRVYMNKKGCK